MTYLPHLLCKHCGEKTFPQDMTPEGGSFALCQCPESVAAQASEYRAEMERRKQKRSRCRFPK